MRRPASGVSAVRPAPACRWRGSADIQVTGAAARQAARSGDGVSVGAVRRGAHDPKTRNRGNRRARAASVGDDEQRRPGGEQAVVDLQRHLPGRALLLPASRAIRPGRPARRWPPRPRAPGAAVPRRRTARTAGVPAGCRARSGAPTAQKSEARPTKPPLLARMTSSRLSFWCDLLFAATIGAEAVEIEIAVDRVQRMILARAAAAVGIDVVVDIGPAPGVEAARGADLRERRGQVARVPGMERDAQREFADLPDGLRRADAVLVPAVGRKGERRQDRDDADDNQELDQGEAPCGGPTRALDRRVHGPFSTAPGRT